MFQLESLDHIMHRGSSKKIGYDNDTNWKNLEPCIPPGVYFVYLVCTNWKWLAYDTNWSWKPIESLWKKSTWYTKVKQMYEHIAYELRYEYLSSRENGSICMKAQFF